MRTLFTRKHSGIMFTVSVSYFQLKDSLCVSQSFENTSVFDPIGVETG